MSNIEQLYAEAVARGAQRNVVGAVGLAGKRAPLATALLRLFVGDNGSAHEVVRCMAEMVITRAHMEQGLALPEVEARELARAVLAWHRDGRCRACGGHGFIKLDGAPGLSDQQCQHCRGSGRVPFDSEFAIERLELARWLAAKVEVHQRVAGAEAMRFLAERMDL